MSVDPTIVNEAMNVAEIAHETVEAAKAAGPIGAFGLNTKIFIAQLVNFGIVLLVLWKFAYTPIVNMLESREEKIEKSVKQAEEIEERMSKTAVESDEILKQARLDAQDIIQKNEEQLEVRRKEMVGKARDEVEKVVAQGKTQMVAEREEMLASIKKEVAEVAILAAQKILNKSVDKDASQKLTEEAIKEAGF